MSTSNLEFRKIPSLKFLYEVNSNGTVIRNVKSKRHLKCFIERRQCKKYRDGTPIDKLPTPIWDGDGYRADGYTPFGEECRGCWVFTASCGQDRCSE